MNVNAYKHNFAIWLESQQTRVSALVLKRIGRLLQLPHIAVSEHSFSELASNLP